MSKRDRDYYLARLAAEREAAERATDDYVRQVHLKLAEEYDQRVSEMPDLEPSSGEPLE